MSEMKIIQPFAPPSIEKQSDIIRNADRWAQIAAKELPDSMAFAFFFVPKAGGLPTIRTNIRPDQFKKQLALWTRRLADLGIDNV